MKKFIISIMLAAFVLSGCAGMQTTKESPDAQAYLTKEQVIELVQGMDRQTLLELMEGSEASYIRAFTAINGGAAGAMDAVGCASMSTNDLGLVFVVATKTMHFYKYVSTASAAEETTHYSVIEPDDVDASCGGDGNWELFNSMSFAPTADPAWTFLDSGNPGLDKEIAKIKANFLSGADTAEDGSWWVEVMIAGTERIVIHFDADTEALTLGDSATGEDLIVDFETTTDNQIQVSSASGVTEISFTALQLVTAGDILGGINVSSKAGAYTIGADDPSENFGTLFTNSNVADLTLPATAIGASGCLMQEAGVTGIIQLEPATSSFLVYEGVEMSDGAPLASAGAATDRICWVAIDATHYLITAAIGVWAE